MSNYWDKQTFYRCTHCGEVYKEEIPKECKGGCKMNEYVIYNRHPNERDETMLDFWARFGGAEPNRIGIAFPKDHPLKNSLMVSGSCGTFIPPLYDPTYDIGGDME